MLKPPRAVAAIPVWMKFRRFIMRVEVKPFRAGEANKKTTNARKNQAGTWANRVAGLEPATTEPHYFAIMCNYPLNIDVHSLIAVFPKCGLAKQCEQKLSLIAPKK